MFLIDPESARRPFGCRAVLCPKAFPSAPGRSAVEQSRTRSLGDTSNPWEKRNENPLFYLPCRIGISFTLPTLPNKQTRQIPRIAQHVIFSGSQALDDSCARYQQMRAFTKGTYRASLQWPRFSQERFWLPRTGYFPAGKPSIRVMKTRFRWTLRFLTTPRCHLKQSTRDLVLWENGGISS